MNDSAPIDPAALPLRDIHLPQEVSWWPPAPGVWLLLALAALLLVVLVVWLAQRQRRQRIRREALKEMQRLQQQWKQQPRPAETAAALSRLLRRVGLSYFGRAGFSGLTGTAEIDCLNRLVTDDRRQLPEELGDWLREAPYRPADALDAGEIEAWLQAVEHWIRALPRQAPGAVRSCEA